MTAPSSVPSPPATAAPAPPRLPAQAVPGVAQVWEHTRGEPSVTIGLYDSPVDLAHPSLAGAALDHRSPWWLPPGPDGPAAQEHGTFTAGVLLGRPGSVLPGLVPGCRVVAVGHHHPDDGPSPDPIDTARALDELLDAGADLICTTIAHHTASDDADDLLKRAVARTIAAGVPIIAPAGNDYGHHSVAPANLPGVLAVGAHRADGSMFAFSNHGPAYAGHGLAALGEAVLGAHPGGGVKAQKGTCVAVALVTGAAALLLSLQHRHGLRPDALAVRDALLATARPCTAEQTHGRPGRCLNGRLDLLAAARHLCPTLALPTTEPAAEPATEHATEPPASHLAAPPSAFTVRPLRRADRGEATP
ncbi:S8 family serine peptidase [Actinomadura sp. ATCC 31491]|uniref:S8 family serine peptidase n=1 Tax=Actinomadura luzonensis TaxID=2805427 RepID=A0ABT0FUV2_9ACTN|nr:S8 family serine peptidase [Actinomadura luzonensis]MCK2215760.1 S8 family serine peptidase [Actinomadura luzonensis]